MEYVLTKSMLTAPMFDGRGYLVSLRDNRERRGLMSALLNSTELYMSRDAVEVVRRWVWLWEQKVQGSRDVRNLSETLHFGDITFVLYDRGEYGYADITDLNDIHPEQVTKIFDTVRENFTTGFDEPTWHGDVSILTGDYVTESYNNPGQQIQFNYNNDGAVYNVRIINQGPVIPYVSRDLTMIRIAEALINIANTKTYPHSGYKLDLKLGFGNLELGELDRAQLLVIAQRLIP